MEDFEDDFGDLYADAEVQASSAINGVQDFARFYTEPGEDKERTGSSDNNKMNAKLSSEDGFDSGKANSFGNELTKEAIDDSDGSDSEDDLNIVLNDEDCNSKKFPIMASLDSMKTHEDCKSNKFAPAPTTGWDNMKNDENEDEDGLVATKDFKYVRTHGSSIPSGMKASGSNAMPVRRDWNHSVRGQCKGPISGQGALVGATPMTQSRGFSLPWYRSILDVNIDTFEEKPWRYPGVDITDFFNFGFCEESWKQYCNSVEQFRRSTFMQSRNPNHVPPNQAHEAGPKYEERVEETMVGDSSQPKGRAIQVEDGFSAERQPSVDVRRPRTLDSDVVIQITLEDSSDTGDKLDHIGSTAVCEADNRPFPHCDGDKDDEFSVESLEENENRVNRCSAKITDCNPVTNDPDDARKNQSPDEDGNHHKESHTFSSDGNHHKKSRSFSSDGTVESFETVNETRESVGLNNCCTDQCMVEPQLSLEEEGQLSLTSSCFESDSEASGESNYLNPQNITSPVRKSSMNSGTDLCESLTSYRKNLKGNHAKIKPVDFGDYSKCKIPVQEEQKHHRGRIDSSAQPNFDDNDASPRSDAEDMHDGGHFSVHCGRRKGKPQLIRHGNKEDVAHHEVSKLSHHHCGRKFSKNYVQTARKNYRKGSEDFHEERDPYLRQNWKKRGYLCEDEKRDGYWCQRGPYNRDLNPLAYKEAKQFESRSKIKVNKVQFRKSTTQFLYRKLDSDFMQERYARPVSLIDQKSDTTDEGYERELPKRGKEVKKYGRNIRENPFPLESEGSWSRKTEHKYWRKTNAHYFSHQSYRESDGGRWTDSISPRNVFSHSRFFGKDRRQASESKESGWLDSYNNCDEFEESFIFPDDQVHFRRKRRCSWKSEVLPWTEEELIVGHQDQKHNAKKSSFFYKKDGRNRINHSTRGSLHDAIYSDDMQSDQHGYKMRRDGNSTRFFHGSHKIYRGKNEQTLLRCRASVDLIVGERKLSGRCQMDRNFCGRRLENTDLEVGQEPNTSLDFNESPSYKVIHSNIQKGRRNPDNEKFHDEFPAAMRNENLDIGEGQILTEEPPQTLVSGAQMQNEKKRKLHDDFASNGSKTRAAYDNQRILETLAKMEKRRERFKEPITLKKEEDECQEPDIFIIHTPEIKQQRPMRKRQWCAGHCS